MKYLFLKQRNIMAFDTNTEKTEGISKSNDLNSVQELNSSQGFITADDILKNCSNF